MQILIPIGSYIDTVLVNSDILDKKANIDSKTTLTVTWWDGGLIWYQDSRKHLVRNSCPTDSKLIYSFLSMFVIYFDFILFCLGPNNLTAKKWKQNFRSSYDQSSCEIVNSWSAKSIWNLSYFYYWIMININADFMSVEVIEVAFDMQPLVEFGRRTQVKADNRLARRRPCLSKRLIIR